MSTSLSPALTIRRLMRSLPRAALGTVLRQQDGAPYVSLVMAAVDHDAAPLLLLSDLADHTRNIKVDPRISLLFDGTVDATVPLAAERATVQGQAVRIDKVGREAARYVSRHPDAQSYLSFGDFNLYRVEVSSAHLVAGFGRIHWIDGKDVTFDTTGAGELALAEVEIVEHMNDDHADAVQLYASRLLQRHGEGWRLTGLDPEGCDLAREGASARLWFCLLYTSRCV